MLSLGVSHSAECSGRQQMRGSSGFYLGGTQPGRDKCTSHPSRRTLTREENQQRYTIYLCCAAAFVVSERERSATDRAKRRHTRLGRTRARLARGLPEPKALQGHGLGDQLGDLPAANYRRIEPTIGMPVVFGWEPRVDQSGQKMGCIRQRHKDIVFMSVVGMADADVQHSPVWRSGWEY